MANHKKEEEGRRINLQLPVSAYDATTQLAAKRKQSISEFIRRAVDFQAWLETVMPDVEGFGADELAKIKLAQKQLSKLEEEVGQLADESEPRGGNAGEEPRQASSPVEPKKLHAGKGKSASAASH